MGFLSKIWRGVKKVFKKIGKGVKKVFAKIGKFGDKFGVVGQIGLMLIPWGTVFSSLFGGIGSGFMNAIAAGMEHGNRFISGASHLINAAVGVGTTIYEGYKTVTGAVKSFIGNTVGYVGKNLNIPFLKDFGAKDALWRTSNNFFGREGVLGQVGKDIVKQWDVFKSSFGQIFKPPVIVNDKAIRSAPGTDQNEIKVDDAKGDAAYNDASNKLASASDNIDYDTSNWKRNDWLDNVQGNVMDESRRSIGVGNNNIAYDTSSQSILGEALETADVKLSGWERIKQETVDSVFGIPGTALATVGTQALLGDQTIDHTPEKPRRALSFNPNINTISPLQFIQDTAFTLNQGISSPAIAYADYMNAMLPFFQQGNSNGMYGTGVPQFSPTNVPQYA